MDVEKVKKAPAKKKATTTASTTIVANKIKTDSLKKKKEALVKDETKVSIAKAKIIKTVKKATSKAFDTELVDKLKSIIAPYTEHPELLKDIERGTNINFVEKLNIDSVDVVEIVVDVELEFDITISDEEIKTFKTFEEMYNLIEYKIKHPVKK